MYVCIYVCKYVCMRLISCVVGASFGVMKSFRSRSRQAFLVVQGFVALWLDPHCQHKDPMLYIGSQRNMKGT